MIPAILSPEYRHYSYLAGRGSSSKPRNLTPASRACKFVLVNEGLMGSFANLNPAIVAAAVRIGES